MKKVILIMLTVMVSMAGAYAQKTTLRFHDTQARALETTTVSHVKPLVVDVEVDTSIGTNGRIEDSWSLSQDDVESMGGDVTNIRSWATFQSAQKHGADVIVAPMYEIKTDNASAGYIVRLIGYVGRFKGWRNISDADYEWVKLEKTLRTSDREKIEAIVKR